MFFPPRDGVAVAPRASLHGGEGPPNGAALVCLALTCLAVGSCAGDVMPTAPPPATTDVVAVLPRARHLATYPCMAQCHQRLAPNPTPRELREFHIRRRPNHGPTIEWCPFCHHEPDLDRLRLINGATVSLDEAYVLCGQCHAEKLRDWRRGVHGSQTGEWLGVHVRRSCTLCHDPHAPHRRPIESLPPPRRERQHAREVRHVD